MAATCVSLCIDTEHPVRCDLTGSDGKRDALEAS